MNKVILSGNMVADPERRTTPNGLVVASFRVAVQRRFRGANGERETDFFNCQAWRLTAEFAAQYLHKGDKVILCGAVQNRQYQTQSGENRTVTEIIVDEIEPCGKRETAETRTEAQAPVMDRMSRVEDDDLPF